MGPPDKGGDWTDEGVEGVFRFLARVWRLGREVDERTERRRLEPTAPRAAARELLAKAHWAIDKVTRDIEPRFQFNTAIAAVMELVNEIYRLKDGLYGDPAGDAAVRFATSTAAVADLPLRAAPRQRRLRAARGRAGLGAALARGRPGAARERHLHPRRAGQRQAPRPHRGRLRAPPRRSCWRSRGRARRSGATSTASRSSRRSSSRASSSTSSFARHRHMDVSGRKRAVLVRRLAEAPVEEWHQLRTNILMDAGELGSRQHVRHLDRGPAGRRPGAPLPRGGRAGLRRHQGRAAR